ncbi:MAG: hypothetical protein QW241_08700 [Candidatus Bathyarchaeia archaeon]
MAAKLFKGEGLNEWDEGWLKEVSEAIGWKLNDVIDELKNVSKDPAERAENIIALIYRIWKILFCRGTNFTILDRSRGRIFRLVLVKIGLVKIVKAFILSS